MHAWHYITHFGAAGLLLPLAILLALALWSAGQTAALWRWAVALSLGAALVLVTKIAFMGWGIGSAKLDFTGISGHATLATAIIPLALALVLTRSHSVARHVGLALGLMAGALVSWSRVQVGAHSVSEVLAGFALGAAISVIAARLLQPPQDAAPRWMVMAGLASMAVLNQVLPQALPTHSWEQKIATTLSGRSVPYSRAMLHDRATFKL